MRAPTAALLLLAACAEGRVATEPSAHGPAFARVALSATVAGGTAASSIRVVAAYAHAGATSAPIPMDSVTIALGSGAVTATPLQLNVTPCVADPGRELPTGIAIAAATARQLCVLHVGFSLRDAAGALLDRADVAVVTEAGVLATAPPVVLGAR
jgi:hypothetical protein